MQGEKGMWKFWDKLRSCSKSQILILFLTGILLFVISIPSEETSKQEIKEPVIQETEKTSSEAKLEEKLEEILSQVSGIGRTRVMISLRSEGRKIVEKDMEYLDELEESGQEEPAGTISKKSQIEETVYEKDQMGNEIPYVSENLSPEISGVLVIAQGAGNAKVKAEITEAIMALFSVDAHKIKVMKMD